MNVSGGLSLILSAAYKWKTKSVRSLYELSIDTLTKNVAKAELCEINLPSFIRKDIEAIAALHDKFDYHIGNADLQNKLFEDCSEIVNWPPCLLIFGILFTDNLTNF